MKDIPIGEFVTLGNEVFKCVKDLDYTCNGCDFEICWYSVEGVYTHCERHLCSAGDREDGEEIVFILYDTLEDSCDD